MWVYNSIHKTLWVFNFKKIKLNPKLEFLKSYEKRCDFITPYEKRCEFIASYEKPCEIISPFEKHYEFLITNKIQNSNF